MASSSIAVTIPSYQPTAADPGQHLDAAARASAATGPAPGLRLEDHACRAPRRGGRARGRDSPARPPPTTSTSGSSRRTVGAPRGASRADRQRAAAHARRTSACTSRYALAQPPRPEESMVIEASAASNREPRPSPRQQVVLDRRPGMLAADDHPVAQRDPARPHARPAVDLALAPAALAGAHISPRGRWNRKLRDRIARPGGEQATATGSPSTPSNGGRRSVNADRRARDLRRGGGAAVAPAPQRMWNVGELSMQTRFDSR